MLAPASATRAGAREEGGTATLLEPLLLVSIVNVFLSLPNLFSG